MLYTCTYVLTSREELVVNLNHRKRKTPENQSPEKPF